jgi:hypothetical protein
MPAPSIALVGDQLLAAVTDEMGRAAPALPPRPWAAIAVGA